MPTTTKSHRWFAAGLYDYLAALRDRVCARCPYQAGPEPRECVLPLAQLIDALEEAQARREGRPPRPVQGPRAGWCLVPADHLAQLAALAADEIERRRRRREPSHN
jgi:hypothetical protein